MRDGRKTVKGQDERSRHDGDGHTCKGKVIIIAIEVKIMRRSERLPLLLGAEPSETEGQ